MRTLDGDSWSLPQAALMNTFILEAGEFFVRNGESCRVASISSPPPKNMVFYFRLLQKVSTSAVGGKTGGYMYAAIRVLAMGS